MRQENNFFNGTSQLVYHSIGGLWTLEVYSVIYHFEVCFYKLSTNWPEERWYRLQNGKKNQQLIYCNLYMIPELKYTTELSMLLMYLIECQVFSGQDFNPVSKQNVNIEFLLKNSQ